MRIRNVLATMAMLAMPAVALGAAAPKTTPAAKPAAPAAAPATPRPAFDTAVFAGGCFWCMETQYETRPGVLAVVSGYTGGPEKNPTYEQVSSHITGHFEAIEIRFDPAKITYAQLVDIFWHSIDPTQDDGQFCDIGHQYRSAIFVRDAAQRKVAEDSKRAIETSHVLKAPIVTEIRPAATFWPAEEYHQDFWKKDPVRYTSYRFGCGRDRRVEQVWGKLAEKPAVH